MKEDELFIIVGFFDTKNFVEAKFKDWTFFRFLLDVIEFFRHFD